MKTYPILPVVLLTALALSGCDTGSDSQITPDRLTATSASASPRTTVLIKRGSRYFLNGENSPLSTSELTDRLRKLAPQGGVVETLDIHAEKGVVGYDVLMVMNAARDAGVRRVEGIAEFAANGPNDKRWSQELVATGGGTSSDTAAHR